MCVVLACRHIPLVTGQHDAACTFQMVGSRSLMCYVPIVIMSDSFVIAVHSGGSILPASGYLPADDRSREGGAPGQSCLQPRKRERERKERDILFASGRFYSRPVSCVCLRFFPSLLSSWFLIVGGLPTPLCRLRCCNRCKKSSVFLPGSPQLETPSVLRVSVPHARPPNPSPNPLPSVVMSCF